MPSPSAPAASASELARDIDLPRSTVARTLRTLADSGFVEEAADGSGWVHRLRARPARAGRGSQPPPRRGRATGSESSPRCDGRVCARSRSRERPTDMEIVLQLDPERHVGVASWVGTAVPLHASSAGKLVLAELADDELDAWLDTHSARGVHREDDRGQKRACARSSRASAGRAGPSSWTSSRTASRPSPLRFAPRVARWSASSASVGRPSGSARRGGGSWCPLVRATAAEVERALASASRRARPSARARRPARDPAGASRLRR